jgi:tetratricopeptide (TPR) repeat protein
VDFLDFEGQDLYFDAPLSTEVAELLEQAAECYPSEESESFLMRGYFIEPEHLTVLVALYRYFYYQHRYQDALLVSDRALKVSGRLLGFRMDWSELPLTELGSGVMVSMGLIRFYLLALKASGYLLLRLGDYEQASRRLDKLAELDSTDQFDSAFLRVMAQKGLRGEYDPESNVVGIGF